jgi:hypothetical protein
MRRLSEAKAIKSSSPETSSRRDGMGLRGDRVPSYSSLICMPNLCLPLVEGPASGDTSLVGV